MEDREQDPYRYVVAAHEFVQAGLLAGRVAQHRWCAQTAIAIDISCEADERYYRDRRRSPLGRRVSRTAARDGARRLVRAHWCAIARLTPSWPAPDACTQPSPDVTTLEKHKHQVTKFLNCELKELMPMPTMTAGRPADADDIRSYTDVIAAHRNLCDKAAAGKGPIYAQAARRVAKLGRLYHWADVWNDQMRAVAETALAAVRDTLRTSPNNQVQDDCFDVADGWLDHLHLLVCAPTDGR